MSLPDPILARQMGRSGEAAARSKILEKCNLLRIFDRAAASPERPICRASIGSGKDMSIESVDQFCLENEALRLVNLSAFDNGEIFVYVAITSDLAGKSRHVSESIRT